MTQSRTHWPLSILGGIVSIFNLLLPLFLVRILTPDEIGHYKIFFLYLVLVPWAFMTAGITNGLGHWSGKESVRIAAFRTSWSILLTIASVALILGLSLSPWLGSWLEWNSLEVGVFVWGAFVTILAGFFEEAAVASGLIWKGAVFSSGFEFFRNLSILGAAIFFRKIEAVFAAHVILITLKVIIGYGMGRRLGFQKFVWNAEMRRPVLQYAVPVSMSAAFAVITNYADQLVLSQILLKSEFAIYAIGCLVVPPLQIFEQSVNRVLIPRMSKLFTENRGDLSQKLFRDSVSELAWIFIPCSFALFIFAEPVIFLLFTQKYAASIPFLKTYCFVYLIMMLPYDAVARARGQGKWILKQLASFSILSSVLVYFLAKHWGAQQALMGVLFSSLLMRSTAILYVSRSEKWALKDMLPVLDWVRYLIFTGIGILLALLIKPLFSNPILWFFAGGFVFSVVYLAGTVSTFLRRRADQDELPRVLILTQYLGLGGLERMVLNLSIGLKRRKKVEPLVLVYDEIPNQPSLHEDFKRAQIRVITVRKTQGFSLRVVIQIVKAIVFERVQVIHSHDLGALIYAVFAKWLSLGTIKIVHTQHSFVHLERNSRYASYERFFSRFTDKMSAVSEGLKQQYATLGINPDPIEVIQNGMMFPITSVNTEVTLLELRKKLIAQMTDNRGQPTLENNIKSTWILCMARIHPGKGQDHVVQLWNQLPKEIRDETVLIFVGQETSKGELGRLKGLLSEAQEHERTVYAGYTLEPQNWLKAADFSISGSEFEGMPLGPIESVGAGTPCIVSDIPGHQILPAFVPRFQFAHPKRAAQVFAAYYRQSEKNRMNRKRLFWSLGAETRKNFGIDQMAANYERVYITAVTRRPTPKPELSGKTAIAAP